LSFTAEEAWAVLGQEGKTPTKTKTSLFLETYSDLSAYAAQPSDSATSAVDLLAKWTRIREVRDLVNKDIEVLRAAGQLGSSLQANISLTVGAQDHALLASLGDDLKFVFITSAIELIAGDALSISTSASKAVKCERCWHYRDDVGLDTAHPTLCGRCTSNLFGAGEVRTVA
jgi:isoleucyl-tRNA synthetase